MSTEESSAPDPAHAVLPPSRGSREPSNGGTKALIGLLLAGIVGMGIFLFVHVSKDGKIQPGPAPVHAECSKGQADCLPDVNYTDTAGTAYSHASLAGKVVLVNFWATWCHPCEKEIPDLSRAYDKYKAKGVVFLGVLTDNVDNQRLLNFSSDHEITYPIVRANSDLMVAYNYPEQLPTTLIFDRNGKQVHRQIGAMRGAELDALLGRLTAQN